ncbi:MAG: CRISPR-associated protein Csm7 [Thiohalocapsa sp.]|nr:CRISPR-associated protein Csm7 [Thiohalocapsa sp.]
METLVLRLHPLTAFGTPLLGDTLFGQVCWMLRHRHGEERLTELLSGYTSGQPFAVVGDALPEGYLPRPALPLSRFDPVPDADPKDLKRRHWLPLSVLDLPLRQWLGHAYDDAGVLAAASGPRADADASLMRLHPQPHNSINRLTGTTGRGDFAPYTQMQRWYATSVPLCCRVMFDPERLQAAELVELFADIGHGGYGRDASIGLGKFSVEHVPAVPRSAPIGANACLTLAPCAPQGLAWEPQRCFYDVFTRFGRHGDLAVHLGNPFKTPLLLAKAGAVLTPATWSSPHFVGQGLGGDGRLSKVIPETVHQGYAPCIPIHLPPETAA